MPKITVVKSSEYQVSDLREVNSCGKGRDTDPSPPTSAEVKNRVQLYLYSP
jgi:hypothetical protein